MYPPTVGPRIVFYSHDTMGLGHVRRNLLIAQAMAQSPLNATSLLVSGVREASQFALPEGVDLICLPAVRKTAHETYTTRQLQMSLDALTRLRGKIIRASVEAFAPDILVVDKVPRGLNGELEETLAALRKSGKTTCVLGLRDVLDEPEQARSEWHNNGNESFVRDHYQSIWIYGDRRVYDTEEACGFAADLRTRTQFLGYLNQQARLQLWPDRGGQSQAWERLGDEPFVLCVIGGGQDGEALAKSFVHAELPASSRGVLVMGPYLPKEKADAIRTIAQSRTDMQVVDFCPESDLLLSRAQRVISMGGYNSVCSILSHMKPALVVPRVWPRGEQLLRARRMQALGLFSMLHPQALSPGAVSSWLHSDVDPPHIANQVSLLGLQSIESLLLHAFSTSPVARTVAC